MAKTETAAPDEVVAPTPKPVTKSSPWFYCLENSHAPNVIDDERFFQSNDEGCPICPKCDRQVSAVPTSGNGVYPDGILAVAVRLI